MKKLLLSIFTILFCVIFKAQELPQILPKSPNTSSLGKYGEVPIGLFTGSPQVGIPLYEFKSHSLSVPITLRYSSNGIRVDQYSSNVGMGWDLNVGGAITRQIKDDPDENHQIPIPDPKTQLFLPSMTNFLVGHSQLSGTPISPDYQPDIYSFNFNGYSGRFFLDDNSTSLTSRTPVLLEPSPVKIEVLTTLGKSLEDSIGDFKITDPYGIMYYFGGSFAVEKSRNSSSCQVGNKGWYDMENAWQLRRIEHPNGEVINFIYESKTIIYDNGISQSISPQTSIGGGSCADLTTTPCLSTSFTKTSYLKEINSSNYGKVTFTYSHKLGMPNNMNKLEKISVYDKNITLIKEKILEYQSYTSNNQIPPNSEKTYHKKRFFLTKVSQKSHDGTLLPAHEFDYYNPEQLPTRFSFSQDYWGYYNGKNNSNLIDSETITRAGGLVPSQLSWFAAANRNPDYNYGIKGLLKKITYPTGGYNTLDYQPHSYSGGATTLPAVTTQTAKVKNSGSSNVFDQFTTSSIPFNQDADIDFIFDLDELFEANGGLSGSSTTDPLTFFVEVTDMYTNQPASIYERAGNSESIIANPYTITTTNFNKNYFVKLVASHSYRVKVIVNRADTTGESKLYYYATNGTSTSDNFEVGGLRIAKIETSDNNANTQIKKYHYGTLDNLLISSGRIVNRNSRPFVVPFRSGFSEQNQCQRVTLYSYSAFQAYASHHIGYSSVVEENGINFANGGMVTTFNNKHSIPFFTNTHGGYVEGTTLSNVFGFGQQLEKISFKKVGLQYITINKVENVYKYDLQLDAQYNMYNVREIRAREHIMDFKDPLNIWRFDITQYAHFIQWHYLNKTINTVFNNNGENPLTTTTNYFYDNVNHLQQTRTETTNSQGEILKTKIEYPQDLVNPNDAEQNLIDNNRLAIPIKTKTFKKVGTNPEKELSYLYTKFNNIEWQGLNLPDTIQTAKGSQPLEDRIIYHSYDNKGNPTEVSKKDGTKIYYVWGYEQTQPIAKIEGYTAAQLASVQNLINIAISESNLDNDRTIDDINNGVIFKDGNEGNLREALRKLREDPNMLNAQVSTFTYDPLIGVTSITDPRGETVYYHYDNFNRLEFVKDKEGNILSKNEYNYKN